MSNTTFFTSPRLISELNGIAAFCNQIDADNLALRKKADYLLVVINYMRNDHASFDKGCRCSIKWSDSGTIAGGRRDISSALTFDDLDMYLVLFYRFVSELDISSPGGLIQELSAFLDFMQRIDTNISSAHAKQIEFVDRRLPILVLKDLLHDEKIGYLGDVPKIAEEVSDKVTGWNRDLVGHQEAVERLRVELDKHKTGFNFVALHKGFNELSILKYAELSGYEENMKFFGFALMALFISEIGFIYFNHQELKAATFSYFGAYALVSLSITMLLVYFFRIALKNAESCKVQLSQLELRKTLCQFVQDYANYAKDIGEKSAETLVKFENIIFSNIVLSDEKIPALFDGFDQIANALRSTQSKSD